MSAVSDTLLEQTPAPLSFRQGLVFFVRHDRGVDYTKPHLSFPEQVRHLQARGLVIADTQRAAHLLQQVGYYRLSAYAYPFRELLPADHPRDSRWQFRHDDFLPGTTFSTVVALWRFDRDLRLLMFDAIETIEVALRVHVAYVLGKRDAFGHLNQEHLDPVACTKIIEDRRTQWAAWAAKYATAVNGARSEDFVRHYTEKYDGRLPIWVGTEVMDFGLVAKLYSLLRAQDRTEIGRSLGVPAGGVLRKWLTTLNYLRNLCAHHSRLWNRRLTYTISSPPPGLVADLEHLSALPATARRKIYSVVAVTAHLVTTIDPQTGWKARLIDLMAGFPQNPQVSPETDMGFPVDWRSLPLWIT